MRVNPRQSRTAVCKEPCSGERELCERREFGEVEGGAETAPVFSRKVVQVGRIKCPEWIDLGGDRGKRNCGKANEIHAIAAHFHESQLQKRVDDAVLEDGKIRAGSVG